MKRFAFFFLLTILQPILFITGIWDEGTYHPVVGYVDQTQDFLIVECPKEFPTERYEKDLIVQEEKRLI